MAEQGAALQKYNQELVKCIEQLKLRKLELCIEIEQEEEVRNNVASEINSLQSKLDVLNNSLKRKKSLLEDCDRSLRESEAAFLKILQILESSQVLLSKVLKESEEIHNREEDD